MRPLLAAFVALLLLPAGAAAQEPVIPLGAKAAGLDIGGLTLSQATVNLQATFSTAVAQPVEVRVAGHRFSLKPARIGFAFDPARTAKRAYDAAIVAPPAPDGTRPVDVPLHVTYDGDKVARFTAYVDAQLGHPRAQRAAADDGQAHEAASRPDGLVDRRAGARARARPAARRPARVRDHARRARARAPEGQR